jgi:hypothetical protein
MNSKELTMWNPFFICGCPRSGTSALRNVFNQDERFAIGMERYYYKAAHEFSLKNSLFNKERFFTLKEGDTFWSDLGMYEGIKPSFDKAVYRGDKIPKLYNHFESLFLELPDSKVLFIIRDIYDVASSYNVRANNINDKNWSRDQNYKVAVDDWNKSLVSLYQAFHEKKQDITPVFYEEFFGNKESITKLYNKLGLPVSIEIEDNFGSFVNKYKQLNTGKKESKLSQEEEEYIANNANFKLYSWLKLKAF